VRKAMDGCEVVMHLAALIAIPFSYHSPDTYVETNVRGTLNVLQAARELGVARIVHTSTSEVYGTARHVPINEEHPLQAQSPYSATKIAADQLALSFHRSFDLPVVVLRPFNTYGPRQSARAVIPATIIQLLARKGPIRLGALHPTRDFSFVTDTARGFIAAAASDAALGQVVNLGSNFEISIGDTAKMIAELTGTVLNVESDPSRMRPKDSEVERLWSDNARADKLLGWRPAYAGLEGLRRGLAQTIEWFRDPANLSAYKSDVYNI
jgi:NAD dependent epimerase/dehydratase